VLTTGYLNNRDMPVAGLEDTGIGIGVGLLVNLRTPAAGTRRVTPSPAAKMRR
jgi:hypothetical protein